MTISYCLCVHNEGYEYLNKLISILKEFMEDNDELIIVDDYSDEKTTVKFLSELTNAKIYKHALNKSFAEHKNFLLSKATKEYIWLFDADEYIDINDMKSIKDIVKSLPDTECFWISRKNIIIDATQETINEFNKIQNMIKFNLINGLNGWPDYQTRIIKNNHNIHFLGKVHERLVGYRSQYHIPNNLSIIHSKSINRQREQLKFYNTL